MTFFSRWWELPYFTSNFDDDNKEWSRVDGIRVDDCNSVIALRRRPPLITKKLKGCQPLWNTVCLMEVMPYGYCTIWYNTDTMKSTCRLLMAWCLFGTRSSATNMDIQVGQRVMSKCSNVMNTVPNLQYHSMTQVVPYLQTRCIHVIYHIPISPLAIAAEIECPTWTIQTQDKLTSSPEDVNTNLGSTGN